MGNKNNKEEPQSGFFDSLDDSALVDTGWSHMEMVHSSSCGMTRVMKARRYGRMFALKCLKSELAGDMTATALLRKEFDLAFDLHHPNIATTLDFVEVHPLGWCIVMEWIDGVTLSDYCREHHLSRQESRSIAIQLTDALDYLHNHQVVHRDLKPSNVMLTTLGKRVKVLDFGLSDASDYASFKQAAGTPGYVAPEVLTGESGGDVLSDIYSLGVMLRELHLSPANVSRRCMAANPQTRYQSAAQVRHALAGRSHKWVWMVAVAFAIFAAAVIVWWLRPGNHEIAIVAPSDTSSTVAITPSSPSDTSSAVAITPSSSPETSSAVANQRSVPVSKDEEPTPSEVKNTCSEQEIIDLSVAKAKEMYAAYQKEMSAGGLSDIEQAKASRQFSIDLQTEVHHIVERAHVVDVHQQKQMEQKALTAARAAIKTMMNGRP